MNNDNLNNDNFASTIFHQLGGNRFLSMVGAKNLTSDSNEKSVCMQIMKNDSKITHFKVILEPNDTYTLKFIKIANRKIKVIKEVTGIYFDQMVKIFEEQTGLYTTL